MMRISTLAQVAGLAVMLPAAGLAQTAKPNTVPKETCTAKAPPPAGMTAWSNPTDLPAARREADLGQAILKPGQAITADLAPVAQVEYRVPPEKADGPETFGGLYRLQITQQGTYRVASSAGPWMDVFVTKTPIKSIAHSHGPDCTGIGKMVDFPLEPGDYLVQFSESLKPQTEIMVAMVGK